MGKPMARILVVLSLTCIASVHAANLGVEAFEEGLRLYEEEEFREAQERFETAVSQAPDNSRYNLWVGLSLGRRAERMSGFKRLAAMSLAKRVKRYFERAIELDASNLEALEALQGFHFQAPAMIGGSMAEAGNLAERIQTVDRARGAVAWGKYYERKGRLESADDHFGTAREVDPDNTGHLVLHAAFLARRGSHAESDQLFDVAFQRDPDNPQLWLGAAKAWIESKRAALYPRARLLLERYIESSDRPPNSDPVSDVRKILKGL